jgi:hypothetical protein
MDEDKNRSGENEKIEVITYSKPVDEPKIGTLRMLMRMALGGAIIGREELKRRFQEQQGSSHISGAELNRVTPIQGEADRARYAAIGAAAKSSDGIRRQASALGRVANRTFGRLTRILQPATNSRVLGPFRRRYQRYVDHGDKVVSEWVAAGRREEYLSRQLAEVTTIEVIEETLDYLAESPELDELVQVQSGDLIGDVFEDLQDNTSKSTLILSNWFTTRIFRRRAKRSQQDSINQAGTQEGLNKEDDR